MKLKSNKYLRKFELGKKPDTLEVIEALSDSFESFPYWEMAGYINENPFNSSKFEFFKNGEKIADTSLKDFAILEAQDYVRKINTDRGKNTGIKEKPYSLFFAQTVKDKRNKRTKTVIHIIDDYNPNIETAKHFGNFTY